MKKIFWVGTETTGVDPQKNCLIQLGYIIEIDGEVKESGQILSCPFEDSEIQQQALAVHGRTLEEIRSYQAPRAAYAELTKIMSRYVDKFNKRDKFVPAGYFLGFDTGMLRSFFDKNRDPYYGSWFTSVGIDVASFVALNVSKGLLSLPNHKLSTICQHYDIAIEAHDALSDIRATRELFLRLTSE